MTASTPLVILVLATVSLMSLMVFALSVICQRQTSRRATNIYMGALLGLAAMVCQLFPIALGNGATLDSRTVMVGVAAAFFGCQGAGISIAIALLTCFYLGGANMASGALAIVLAGTLGYGWRLWLRPKWRAGIGGLTILGTMISLHLLAPLPLMPPDLRATFYQTGGIALAITNIIGAVVFGTLIRREFALQRTTESLRLAANTDPLTGLSNRRHLISTHDALSSGDRALALIYLDLDHFKSVNDRHGHAVGDDLLVQVGRVLSSVLPQGATAARIGGEEFAVLLPGASLDHATKTAERIRKRISALRLTIGDRPLRVTASAGLSHRRPGESFDTMLSEADECLYRAKEAGRNRLVVPAPAPRRRLMAV